MRGVLCLFALEVTALTRVADVERGQILLLAGGAEARII